ncbi:MAG: ABC transporter permease [Anaerolineae bacterium]|nr:ABC transporter permease [Anaerolineae bacterium]
MRIIDLTLNDLKQIVRDWKTALFLVVMPIGFTLFFGVIFGGEQDPRLPVGFIDQDGGSVLGPHLLDLLDASDAIRPIVSDESIERAEKKVSDEEWAAAVIVPAGYSERVLAGEDIALTVIVDGSTAAGSTAQTAIQAAVARLQGAVKTAQLSAEALRAQGKSADERLLIEALDETIEAWREPPLTVSVAQSGIAAEEDEEKSVMETSYGQASPGMMVQFSIAGIMSAAQIVVLERKSRSLQRLLTTAISRVEIILGHYLTMFVMIFVQLALLIGFGQLALGIDYMREPVATLLLAATMSLWTAGLGLLIGVLAKTEDQTVIFSMIPMFILSGLGGAWMPLEVTGEAFQTIGHLLPTAWAMDGIQNIIVRGMGLESALLPSGIMMAYAIALFTLAAWRFKFE